MQQSDEQILLGSNFPYRIKRSLLDEKLAEKLCRFLDLDQKDFFTDTPSTPEDGEQLGKQELARKLVSFLSQGLVKRGSLAPNNPSGINGSWPDGANGIAATGPVPDDRSRDNMVQVCEVDIDVATFLAGTYCAEMAGKLHNTKEDCASILDAVNEMVECAAYVRKTSDSKQCLFARFISDEAQAGTPISLKSFKKWANRELVNLSDTLLVNNWTEDNLRPLFDEVQTDIKDNKLPYTTYNKDKDVIDVDFRRATSDGASVAPHDC